ncbi:MAG: hypothetical protein HGA45_34480 [Chloroflexales bacterium]|nr:hypothetical protein [Chloroflexales bacterium]
MSHHLGVWRLRALAALFTLISLVLLAAFPRPAWAACGPLDMGACVDNAEYSFYSLIASIAWNINRWLLLLAYQFDQLRAWLIGVAFSGAYQWLTSFIQPVYVPIATAALMLAAILFRLVPLTGETGFVTIRHVMLWAILTPLLLAVAGQMIGQAEQVRSDVSAQLFTQMSHVAPGAIFGASGSDMPAPAPLYPANPCGSTLTRSSAGIALDALAATLMYADAGDIHCPDARGPSRDIPDGFYREPPSYAYDGYVGDLDSSVERRGWVEGMQRGMNRLLQGIIPSFLAVLESLIHLVFSLSMAVLWLSLPIGLIFVWFQQTASPVTALLQRAASVLIVSWTSSMLMGFLSAALVAAADLGNAGAYTGMAFGALFLMGYLCIVAMTTLWKSIGTIEQTALNATGMSVTQPMQLAAQLATTTAAGAVSGGAAYLGMAAAGSTAFAQSQGASLPDRVSYTASAMVGRIPGMGSVGEVAAAMGWLDTDSATYQGLYAGERSGHSWRSSRLQMERDHGALQAPRAGQSGAGSSGAGGGPGAGPAAPGGAGPQGPAGRAAGPAMSGPASPPGTAGTHGSQGQARPVSAAAMPAPVGAGVPQAQAGLGSPMGAPAAGGVGTPQAQAGVGSPMGAPAPAGAGMAQAQAGLGRSTGAPAPAGAGMAQAQAGPVLPAGASSGTGSPGLPASPGGAQSPLGTTNPPGASAGIAQSQPGSVNAAPTSAGISTSGTQGQAAPAASPGAGAGGAQRQPTPAGLTAASVGQPTASPDPTHAQAARQLPAEHPHVAYAAAQLAPMPSPMDGGQDWQYAGSVPVEAGYRHVFRHPRHPLTGRPERREIATTTAEVEARQRRQHEEPSA